MQNTVNLTWTTSSADCHFGSSQINCTTIKLIGVTNALQKIHLTWTTDIADCYFRPSQINCNGHNFKYRHSWKKLIDSIVVNLIRYFMCQEIEGPLHTTLASNRYLTLQYGTLGTSWQYLVISAFFVNVRKSNTPLPPTFASVHIWLTPPPPYSANVICIQPQSCVHCLMPLLSLAMNI